MLTKNDKIMNGARCMTWKEFKESLDNMPGKKILYIDEEGTEIPINTDAEFQEALRLAKRQGNRVRFVLVNETSDEERRPSRQNSKPKEKKEKFILKETRHSKQHLNEEMKEAVYVNDAPPEWFVSFMKKFKKDLMAEVNNTIHDTIRKALKKEAKAHDDRFVKEYEWENGNNEWNHVGTQYYYRSDGGYEALPYFVTSQTFPASGNVRMKLTERVYVDPLKDDRRGKQFAKMDKVHVNFVDKRQKVERFMNMPTYGQEERVRIWKSKPYPKVYISYVHDFGPMKSTKSASFTSNLSLKKLEVLQPYALWFLLGNNGSVPWSNNAYVKCFYNPEEFDFEDSVIDLPSLEPGVGANVVYEVTPLKVGSFLFTCAIIDNGVEIAERILCRFEVVEQEGTKVPKPMKIQTLKKDALQPCGHYDDEFSKTQKKIKDNIKTIMKRLDDIEILNSDATPKKGSKKKEDDSVKVGQKRNRKKRKEGATVELRTGVFDLLQNLESIRENEEGKPKDDEKEVVKDKLVGKEDKQAVVEDKKEKQNENGNKKNQEEGDGSDGNQSPKNESKKEAAADSEKRDSDSELSIIMGSEEDDNFIVLSMPSRTPSPETQVKELKNEKEIEMIKKKEEEKENIIKKEIEMIKKKEEEKENIIKKEIEMIKKKEEEKEKEAIQKQSPREQEKRRTFESSIFDPWNENNNGESARFDPWNEMKSQLDPFDDGFKIYNEKKKWGFHVVSLPEGVSTASRVCIVNPDTKPEEMLAKLKKASNMFSARDADFTLLSPGEKAGGNIVFVVDKGGKVVPVVNGKPIKVTETTKNGAETGRQQKRIEAGKQQKNAEAKENKGEISGGASSKGSPIGSEQFGEHLGQPKANQANLQLYNAASDAVTKVASVFSNIHSAFLPAEKKRSLEERRPSRMMEMLRYLEEMGFKDRIRNRELLLMHNLNMSAVIDQLLVSKPNPRNAPPTALVFSTQGIWPAYK